MKMKNRFASALAAGAIAAAALFGSSSAQATTIAGTVDRATSTAYSSPVDSLREPAPNCGDHVTVDRTGTTVSVNGVDLGAFMPSGVDYAVSDTYEEDGSRHGMYNASRYARMSYSFSTSDTSAQQFRVVLSSVDQSTTYCVGYYTA
jgi:hypothetical protein